MAFQSMTDAGRKFGSKFRQKKFDSYHGGDQPAGNESNEKSEPKDTGSESRATHVHYAHDHDNGKHTVTKTHSDGSQMTTSHPSAAEAYEAGGEQQATDVKKRNHPDQQGAEPEEANYEAPDLVI
jgi:hypothetical protein